MPKIEVTNLTKVFGKHPSSVLPLLAQGETRESIFKKSRHVVGLNRISFSVREGELLVVMGLSGSGKSTLLRCINRLIEPTSGSIRIDGEDITKLPPKELRLKRQQKFGMVFQHFALFPHYNVLRNAAYGLELMKVSKKEREPRAMEALERVGLGAWAKAMPNKLSGGMKQRVGLARALALNPEILLMDEAFSALDPLTRREMQSELLRLQHEMHKTIIFISHDMDEALSLGDRIILLRDGDIVQEGTPEDILANPADEYVADFVRHADRSRVLTTGSIMVPASSVAVLGVDGPHTALRKIRHHELSSLFVLDAFHTLLGLVREDELEKMRLRGKRDLAEIMETDLVTVGLNASINDVIPISASLPYPLPVVDEKGRLQGVILRGTLLEALGGNFTQDESTDNSPDKSACEPANGSTDGITGNSGGSLSAGKSSGDNSFGDSSSGNSSCGSLTSDSPDTPPPNAPGALSEFAEARECSEKHWKNAGKEAVNE